MTHDDPSKIVKNDGSNIMQCVSADTCDQKYKCKHREPHKHTPNCFAGPCEGCDWNDAWCEVIGTITKE